LLGVVLILLILPAFHYAANHYRPIAPWPPFLFIIGLLWLILPKTELEHSTVSNFVSARESA
jgi:hypothetical protein